MRVWACLACASKTQSLDVHKPGALIIHIVDFGSLRPRRAHEATFIERGMAVIIKVRILR